ncbi:DMT family transporter [Albidovulum sp.]|uniref:DMT family transporter n=1 Tax=Albidovulum sp. TaxID=1872424 RepID=UPI0039B82C2D
MTDSARPARITISAEAWALMLFLALLWGGAFPATRQAVSEAGVLTVVAIRAGGGALALWLYILARGLPVRLGRRRLAAFAAMGLLNNVLPWCLLVWGQRHIEAGLAAILNASTAFFAVALAAIVFRDERMSAAKAAGLALGLAGVILVTGIDALTSLDPGSLAQLAVLATSASYACANVFARRFLTAERPEVAAAGMLTASSLVMVPLALWREGLPGAGWHAATWGALGYLGLAASALAFLCYYRALRLAGAGNVGLVTLMVAPVSVALGALIFGEALTAADYAGFLLLAAGLLVIDGRLAARRRGGSGKKPRELPGRSG